MPHSEHGNGCGNRSVKHAGTGMVRGQQKNLYNHSRARIDTGKDNHRRIPRTTVRNPTEADSRIPFPQTIEIQAMGRREAADIVPTVNQTLAAGNVPLLVRLQRLTHNEDRNLSGLLRVAATSSMILPAIMEVILIAT